MKVYNNAAAEHIKWCTLDWCTKCTRGVHINWYLGGIKGTFFSSKNGICLLRCCVLHSYSDKLGFKPEHIQMVQGVFSFAVAVKNIAVASGQQRKPTQASRRKYIHPASLSLLRWNPWLMENRNQRPKIEIWQESIDRFTAENRVETSLSACSFEAFHAYHCNGDAFSRCIHTALAAVDLWKETKQNKSEWHTIHAAFGCRTSCRFARLRGRAVHQNVRQHAVRKSIARGRWKWRKKKEKKRKERFFS